MSDRLQINYQNENNEAGTATLDMLPDTCPQCNHKIDPIKSLAFLNTKKLHNNRALEVVFRCTNVKCHEVFLAYYSKRKGFNIYDFEFAEPKVFNSKSFSTIISDISSNFPDIYNQALKAETSNLDLICGTGYRKALEFLVKDYLIKKATNEEEKEDIKKEFLGKSIKDRIVDASIQEVAKRATWLGNDETHYTRKWDEKDLQDLKKLIDLTVHWMEAESLTEQLLNDMPEGK